MTTDAAPSTSGTTIIHQRPVAAFFVLTYLIAWPIWGLSIGVSRGLLPEGIGGIVGLLGNVFAGLAPGWAAIIVLAVVAGKPGTDALFQRFTRTRAQWWWYVVALFGNTALMLGALALLGLFGAEPLLIAGGVPLAGMGVGALLLGFLMPGIGEEFGWRGFALPRLQARYSDLAASVIIGVFWGLWHLPTYLIAGNAVQQIPIAAALVLNVAISVVYTWIFNHTGGSTLFVSLFHVTYNVSASVLLLGGLYASSLAFSAYTAIVVVVAFILVVVYGPQQIGPRVA